MGGLPGEQIQRGQTENRKTPQSNARMWGGKACTVMAGNQWLLREISGTDGTEEGDVTPTSK